MKERIYTIPVTDAFNEDCECPMCQLEKRFEEESVLYYLGPSLMEPDCRLVTNHKGFCKRHFELMYNKKENTLGLGLMLETHIEAQNENLGKIFKQGIECAKKDAELSVVKTISNKISSKQTATQKAVDDLIAGLISLHRSCTICEKLSYTMDRYIDVILYLWFNEKDFRDKFVSKKGFCLKHLKMLLEGTKKYLSARETAVFVECLFDMQMKNMQRIKDEVSWFTKKFDYRNNDAPWGNSKDAVPRSIQKLVGYSDLK